MITSPTGSDPAPRSKHHTFSPECKLRIVAEYDASPKNEKGAGRASGADWWRIAPGRRGVAGARRVMTSVIDQRIHNAEPAGRVS